MRNWCAILAVLLTFATASSICAREIGFVEDFAISADRTETLKQMIPGTEDYYYYHCLHYLNTEQSAEVEKLLQPWIKRYGRTDRAREIEYRRALLEYGMKPTATLDYLRQELNINFSHQQEVLNQKPNRPTALSQDQISQKAYIDRALVRHPNTLDGFEDSALDWVAQSVNLDPIRSRNWLMRLQRADIPDLPALIVADLNQKDSQGFGSMTIHNILTLEQLNACDTLLPGLHNETRFVQAYLMRLRPGADVDWQHDTAERQAYLDRLWAFVSTLDPAHNSLKTHVLYHRLRHDIALGVFDKERFMAYVQLPRNVAYISRTFIDNLPNSAYRANLNQSFLGLTQLNTIGNDEDLVRDFLQHFFLIEKSYDPYLPYINDVFLKENYAETMIVNAQGTRQDQERWYSMLPPSKYQALKDRIDLDFSPENKTFFQATDPVSLDLYVKNVKTLIVKIYEISSLNYYREFQQEVSTDINLDGLVANEESVHSYEEPPLQRVKRHFEFPQLKDQGIYVVEFIGNGKSSRALIRKGSLQIIERIGSSGHLFKVVDGANKTVPDARIWFDGSEYKADKTGFINIPFSTAPGRKQIILSHNDFSALAWFNHQSEQYTLSAGIYVDRESLLKSKDAKVVIRPSLSLLGVPVSLEILEQVKLLITSTDNDGIATTKEIKDIKFDSKEEYAYEFKVPERLASISFLLSANVRNITQNKDNALTIAKSFSLNGIDKSEKVAHFLLSRLDSGYMLDYLGRSGEARAERPITFQIKHRDFRDVADIYLQSDEAGRINLGTLKDIEWIQATGPESENERWTLLSDQRTYPANVNGVAGEPILIPYMGSATTPNRLEMSLFEKRAGVNFADCFQALQIADGFILIEDLPAGDYELLLKQERAQIVIRITGEQMQIQPTQAEGYALGANRYLELTDRLPLQISEVEENVEDILIRLTNSDDYTRVHVIATRYLPAFKPFSNLSGVPVPEPYTLNAAKNDSVYLSGRDIGDEYRYIIERKYAEKFPGMMLERPGLLLNPWAVRNTETAKQDAQTGDEWDRAPAAATAPPAMPAAEGISSAQGGDFANLDFLTSGSVVLLNLKPDENGNISIKRSTLKDHPFLQVIALDPRSTIRRQVSIIATSQPSKQDVRLRFGLDPQRHFTEQKQISIVRKGETFKLADAGTAKMEIYDSFSKVYRLYATLSNDTTLAEFGFILNWSSLSDAEKREKYSKYACHELNFLLFKRDKEFFDKVILPYIANKKEKTFLDNWFLWDALTESASVTADYYQRPWAYEQINIAERALLGIKGTNERERTLRHIADLNDLIPPNIERFNHLFNTAIQSSAMEQSGPAGLPAVGFAFYAKDGDQLDMRGEMGGARGGRMIVTNGVSTRELSNFGAVSGTIDALYDAPQSHAVPAITLESAAVELKLGELADKKSLDAGLSASNREEAKEKLAFSRARFAAGKMPARMGGMAIEEDLARRSGIIALYRTLEKTQEFAENNYYHLPLDQTNASRVQVNSFWRDYAKNLAKQTPFFSPEMAEPSGNFTEMMFALALLDLPETPGKHEVTLDAPSLLIKAASPFVIYHKEIREATEAEDKAPILVSQNFFRNSDRYRHVNNEQFDKFVTDEFLVQVVYGCQIVITNPTSSRQKLDALIEVPIGAVPVMNCQYTRSVPLDLQPYNTTTIEYFFYFPAAGKFPHYPVHIARNGELLAYAEPFTFNAVNQLTQIDKTSWDYVSQFASPEEVIEFLHENNINRLNLDRIAWRMKDKAYFAEVLELLEQRHVYNNTLWSYSISHNTVPAIRQYLLHRDDFIGRCGNYLESELLTIDPVERKSYEHLEYKPLVNARTHRLGKEREILNNRFYDQYARLMKILTYRPALDSEDQMAVTYYMLLQDRYEEALRAFEAVDATKLKTQIQYDYFAAYLDYLRGKYEQATEITKRYENYPVDRWNKLFSELAVQLKEVRSGTNAASSGEKVIDKESRTEAQTRLASLEPSLDIKVESLMVELDYQNITEATVRYYPMDIELLFSRNPFVQEFSGQFSSIRPNLTDTITLDASQKTHKFELPSQFHKSNVMIEVEAKGIKRSKAYYSNALDVQTIENYGQILVTHDKTGAALPTVYVKVYAKMRDGQVRFYKDGYTDPRGRFDYTSLSTNELENVQRFSLLILSETEGAMVREAAPPKQ